MLAGIDFGTSNCSIGVWEDNAPKLIPLDEESTQLASALYTARSKVEIENIDENKLQKRLGKAKNEQKKEAKRAKEDGSSIKTFSDSELENRERELMRRELAERAQKEYNDQTISDALYADSEIVFGKQAILHHIQDPLNGYFIKSPKSFLGADIRQHHIDLFSEIITRILSFIKNKAEENKGKKIDSIVLGHPVNFHGTRGEEGNLQAINILEQCSIAAGYKNIEFLMEPIAAALDFERSLEENVIALVLDAGGGTTDCSVIKLGPAYKNLSVRDDTILGYAGTRIGGTDLDIKLAMRKIMPEFGKDALLSTGLSIPNSIFWNAISINDVNAQSEFLSNITGMDINQYLTQTQEKKKVNRLKRLYEEKLSFRLNRSAELAKIHLSDRDPINLPIKYIENDFVIPISRLDLKDSIDRELDVFISLMKEAEKQSNTKPDIIYVTGGTAKSPIVEDAIRSNFGDVRIIIGDLFGSVTSGLTTWAHQIYQ